MTLLLYELEEITHMLFCRASFTESFYHTKKILNMCSNVKRLIIKIELGLLGQPLCRISVESIFKGLLFCEIDYS
jgi:hypothetical protein